MRIIFTILFILCCSLSSCFAGVGDDFAQEITHKVAQLRSLYERSQDLNESNTEEYFGKKYVNDTQVEKTKELFRLCYLNMDSFAKQKNWTALSEDELGQALFPAYCRQVYLIKNLYTEKSKAQLGSIYCKDTEQGIESLDIYHRYFPKTIDIMSSFLSIEQNGRKNGLTKYFVRLNDADWYLTQRRNARNFLNRLSLLDLEQLALPEKYKRCLQEEIDRIKKENAEYFGRSTHVIGARTNGIRDADMSHPGDGRIPGNAELYLSTENYKVFSQLVHIQDRDNMICFSPLDIRFSDGTALSPEERIQNAPLLDELLEKKAPIALSRASAPSIPIKKPVKKKNGRSKKKRIGTRMKTKAASSVVEKIEEVISILPTRSSELSSSQDFVVDASDLGEFELSSPVKDLGEKPICDILLPLKSKSSSVQDSFTAEIPSTECGSSSDLSSFPDLEVSQDDLENIDPHLFVREWLKDIIKASQSKNETFGIFEKALRLDSMLEKNSALLEQVQEATVGLATRLQMLEQGSLIHSLSRKVPQNLESDFLYFMDTPIRYLKGLRFGYVSTLFENLGIKIDKSMAGSRMHFSFRTKQDHYETSIHLHDKHNGELDGGRLSTLRKFLIDCGFIYSETQSAPAQTLGSRRVIR